MLNKLDRYKTTFEDQVRAARSSAPASEPVFSSVSLVFGLFILEGARLQAAAQLRYRRARQLRNIVATRL